MDRDENKTRDELLHELKQHREQLKIVESKPERMPLA